MIEKCYCSCFIGRGHENNDRRNTHTHRRRIARLRQLVQAERTQKTMAEREMLRIRRETTEKDGRIRELEEALERETTQWAVSRREITLTFKVLGRGAWGRVAEGIFKGCKVAVKEIHHIIVSQHNINIFRREINTQWKCRHPNIVQMIAATNEQGRPLIVTELMDTSLRQQLSKRSLSNTETLAVAKDVALGLNFLHRTKPVAIIHRDISSVNVLLTQRGNSWTAKLADFGSSNFMQKTMSENPGAAIYAAPEASTTVQTTKVNINSEV